ncbi:MAG: hypothetical protein DDT19_01092 [Syntrophomonadaceae bacterium]|nr:hypothetical protein [Bacillota bacterium]
MSNLVKYDFQGVEIAFQGKDQINLTDLWRAVKGTRFNKPHEWSRKEGSVFIEFVSQNLNTPVGRLLKTTQGRNGGTWAHWQIALAYAKYLSPELHMWANQVVKERLEEDRDPELGITRSRARAVAAWERQGKDQKWIEDRIQGISTRKAFTGKLQQHGVISKGYGKCTNAIYEPMFGGKTAVLKQERGLKKSDNLRDHLGNVENIGIRLAEALAGEKIEEKNYWGDVQCSSACWVAGSTVAEAIQKARKII